MLVTNTFKAYLAGTNFFPAKIHPTCSEGLIRITGVTFNLLRRSRLLTQQQGDVNGRDILEGVNTQV